MSDGWLKIYRKLTDWEWYNHSEMVHLFLHLLIKASPVDKTWQGMSVQRGQVVIGRQKLSAETGISERTVRTCLSRLEKSGEIEIKSTNKFSIITICKYGDYQPSEQKSDQQNDQQNDQPTDQPTDHIIRSKEKKNIISSSTPSNEGAEEVPPAKKSSKRKNPEEYTLVTKGRKVFESVYKELFSESYVWRAKDAAAMQQLFDSLKFSRKSKKVPLPLDDDSLVQALDFLLRHIQNEWILQHFTVGTINSQYNNIVTEIANKRNGTFNNNQRPGDATIARQMSAVVNDIAKADEYYYKEREEQSDSSSQ